MELPGEVCSESDDAWGTDRAGESAERSLSSDFIGHLDFFLVDFLAAFFFAAGADFLVAFFFFSPKALLQLSEYFRDDPDRRMVMGFTFSVDENFRY